LDEKNVLRLQISVDKVQVVQKGNASEQLLSKLLDVRAREWHEAVRLEKVEYTLTVEIGYNANVVAEVEAVPQVDTSVDVVLVVGGQCREHSQFDATGVTVLWHRSNDLDGALVSLLPVPGLDDLAERSLAEQLQDLVWNNVSIVREVRHVYIHRSVRSASGTTI
jgi:hypothetical protein